MPKAPEQRQHCRKLSCGRLYCLVYWEAIQLLDGAQLSVTVQGRRLQTRQVCVIPQAGRECSQRVHMSGIHIIHACQVLQLALCLQGNFMRD